MLDLEVPNLQELDLDRVIAFGHTWSPTLELTPRCPSSTGTRSPIDMALSTTIAEQRGYISVSERDRIFWLFSRVGLALTSPYLTPELLRTATDAILQTRGGLLRAAVPRPIGRAYSSMTSTVDELDSAGHAPGGVPVYPRGGAGEDMFTSPIRRAARRRREPVGRRSGEHGSGAGRPVTPASILAAELDLLVQPLNRLTVSTRSSTPGCGRSASSPAGWIPTWAVDHAGVGCARPAGRTHRGPGLEPARATRCTRAGDALRSRRRPNPANARARRPGRSEFSRSACSPAIPRSPWPRRCPRTGAWWPARSTREWPTFAQQYFDSSANGTQDHHQGGARAEYPARADRPPVTSSI